VARRQLGNPVQPPCRLHPGLHDRTRHVARLKDDFDRRNVKAIGLSVDSVESHHRWERDIAEIEGIEMNFPMIADTDRAVSTLYDMIHPNASETTTIRSVFIISPQKKISLMLNYPMSTGRNFDEILRVIDSLQLTATEPVPRQPTGSPVTT
jgi:thioredoxin-dependent peroxiredoxin